MSGFEVAGIVLGAFPIAITALDKYREVATRLGLFFKIQIEYKYCRDDLEFHQLMFSRNLRQLVLPLVVADNEIDALLSDPGGEKWKDARIAALLMSRLGDSYKLYFNYVSGVKRVVDDINHELAVDMEPVQQKLDSLKAKYGATKTIPQRVKDTLIYQRYRLKFSNGEATRKRLFGEVQAYNDKLEKLLDSTDQDTRIVRARLDSSAEMQLNAIEGAICNFWIHASILFRALVAAWRCRCQQHEAKLLLEHRMSEKLEFNLVFTNKTSSQWEIQKTRIARGEDESGPEKKTATVVQATNTAPVPAPRQPSHRQDRPMKSAIRRKQVGSVTAVKQRGPASVTVTAPTMTITSSIMTVTPVPPIPDLCASLQTKASYCGYLPGDGFKYHVYTVSHRTAGLITSVTLDQILRREVEPAPRRSQRYELSLAIASSFIQLLDSPWFPPASINKSDILFLSDLDKPDSYLLDQPHIRRDLTNTCGQATTRTGTSPGPNSFTDALDHLGIVLLELCFGEVLQDQECRKRWRPVTSEQERVVFDVAAAREWQREVNDEAGADFAEAVAWCLGGNRSVPPDRWRHEMVRRVIKPLQRCVDYLKGRV